MQLLGRMLTVKALLASIALTALSLQPLPASAQTPVSVQSGATAVGDLPLTLTAEAEVAFQPGFFGWNAAAGFEYAVGNGGPVTLHGGVELGGGGFWSVEAGIGLKLGEGRLSGFRELDF